MRRRYPLLLALIVLSALLLAACSGRESPRPTASSVPPGESPRATESNAPPSDAGNGTVAFSVNEGPISLPPTGTDGYPWWNDTVWYEIFVRSFYDSDGDGIGDLNGITTMLDYLNDGDPATTDDLGVTGIWLMPIAESPSYHGYDVVDYRAIERDYGTADDFKRLIEEAHKRGIRVIVDLVLNHTSSQHPWFKAALDGDPKYVNWYRFVEGEQPVQFAPWGGDNIWHPAGANRYYYGIFWSEMPDLNYENPDVQAEMYDVTRFWLEEMGVDGFRLDAIRHLIEVERQVENTAETHTWLKEYHDYVKNIAPDAFIVGEVWSDTDKVVPYLANDELDSAFEFLTADSLLNAAASENAGPVRIAFGLDNNLYPPLEYATFLANHDQNRTFSVLAQDMNHARTAAAMLLTGPGIPFIYYGEEVAMQGRKPDEDIRLPFPWTGDENGGFTTGEPWRALPRKYEDNNVAAMMGDPASLLSYYQQLIALRNNHSALRVGDYIVLKSSTSDILPFIRQSEDETLLVIHNLTGKPISDYSLEWPGGIPINTTRDAFAGDLMAGIGGGDMNAIQSGGPVADYQPLDTLEPYTTYVLQMRP